MKYINVCVFFLLVACSITATGEPKKSTLIVELENTQTSNLIKTIFYEYPTQEPKRKAGYLKKRLKEFEERIELRYLSKNNKKEIAVLEFLANKESSLKKDTSFSNRVRYLSSLTYPIEGCFSMLMKEKAEIEKNLSKSQLEFLTPRQSKTHESLFFESNDYGRQKYLDLLAYELKNTENLAFTILRNYPKSALKVVGETEANFSFYYRDRVLRINIDNMETMPKDETIALAAFFGLPGAGAIEEENTISLSKFLYLPSYNLGWAAYSLNEIAKSDPENSEAYLRFSKLIVVLGLTDLNIHSGKWTSYEGREFIKKNSYYSSNREQLFLEQVQARPGLFLSINLGKIFFNEMKRKCLEKSSLDFCGKALNQLIVDQGTVPLQYLKNLLIERFFSNSLS